MPNPLIILLVTLGLGSWANALYFLGAGSTPAGEGAADPGSTVGWASLLTGFGIGFTSLFLVFSGSEPLGDLTHPVGGLAAAFAFVWILLGVIQTKGLDLRPLGNITVWVGALTVLFIFVFLPAGAIILGTTMIIWAIGLFTITLVAYGRVSATLLGLVLLVFAIWTTFLPVALSVLSIDSF